MPGPEIRRSDVGDLAVIRVVSPWPSFEAWGNLKDYDEAFEDRDGTCTGTDHMQKKRKTAFAEKNCPNLKKSLPAIGQFSSTQFIHFHSRS